MAANLLVAGQMASSAQKISWHNIFRRSKSSQALQTDPSDHHDLVNAVYYPNWRVYKAQRPSSLNLKYITHIFYAFAWSKEDGTIYLSDEHADVEMDVDGGKGCLNSLRTIKVHHPQIKTLLSVGGGGKGSVPLPTVAGSAEARARFAWTAKEMLEVYELDGIDVDWEHPSSVQQGADYVKLLAALREELPASTYLLTSALPAGEWVLKNINLRQAAQYLDHINLMTYDFTGPWTSICGHHAQLYTPKHPHDDASRTSCSSAVAYTTSQGVPSEKLLLGIPCYGRSFLGAKKVGDSFHGHGGEEGTYEYRDLPRKKASVTVDANVGAVYCVGGDGGFVSYDDSTSVGMKAEFAKQQRLGGMFYWTGTGDTNDARSLVEAGWKGLNKS